MFRIFEVHNMYVISLNFHDRPDVVHGTLRTYGEVITHNLNSNNKRSYGLRSIPSECPQGNLSYYKFNILLILSIYLLRNSIYL